ncbi:MAG: hypothetical protein IJ006_04745, partial [Lachnospiraceae bacterium]|nr:hypothetical protein [Lachnospiraceae bacterium]
MIMATLPGRPIRALLFISGTIRKSNILHDIQIKYIPQEDSDYLQGTAVPFFIFANPCTFFQGVIC